MIWAFANDGEIVCIRVDDDDAAAAAEARGDADRCIGDLEQILCESRRKY